eukprot:447338_1
MVARNQDYDHLLKVLLMGDSSVGKSSILRRQKFGTFDVNIESTIGVDFLTQMMEVEGKKLKLTLWDTAGQERFRTLTSSYYRGAHGILLVYDVTRRDTFENLPKWLEEVETFHPSGGREVVKLLIGNKIDLENRKVSRNEGEEWARSKKMMFLEASAKTQVGIKQAFSEVVHKICENPVLLTGTAPGKPRGTVSVDERGLSNTRGEDEGYCC